MLLADLPDEVLRKAYKKAVELHLGEDFIALLTMELERRQNDLFDYVKK